MASLASLSCPRPGGAAGGPFAELPTPVGPLPPTFPQPVGKDCGPFHSRRLRQLAHGAGFPEAGGLPAGVSRSSCPGPTLLCGLA